MSSAVWTVAEPISPELALVSPELGEQARRHLAPHPWQLVAAREAMSTPPLPLQGPAALPAWLAASLYLVVTLALRVSFALVIATALTLTLGFLAG